jgi:hypothetical protein
VNYFQIKIFEDACSSQAVERRNRLFVNNAG